MEGLALGSSAFLPEHAIPTLVVEAIHELFTLGWGKGRETILNEFACPHSCLANLPVIVIYGDLTIVPTFRADRGWNGYHSFHCNLQSVLAGLLGTR